MRANGKLALGAHTAAGRRLRELVRIYSADIDLTDEKALALARSTASVALKAEAMEDAADRGDAINPTELVRLINLRERNLRKLTAMRAEASPPAVEAKAGLARLRAKLAQLARQG
jgi:hypothetical protein